MSNLVLTIRESIRYRGRGGHWSWVAHRVSGLAILLFLIIHPISPSDHILPYIPPLAIRHTPTYQVDRKL